MIYLKLPAGAFSYKKTRLEQPSSNKYAKMRQARSENEEFFKNFSIESEADDICDALRELITDNNIEYFDATRRLCSITRAASLLRRIKDDNYDP